MGPGIAACRKEWLERLQQMGIDTGEALARFRWVLSHVTGIAHGQIPLQSQMLLTTDQQQRMEQFLSRLEQQEPLQYILKEAWFYGRPFEVNPSVLIPRPETEELIQWILDDHAPDTKLHALDLGTGSGCIPITLKLERPDWQIAACDLSTEALVTARGNAERHRVNLEWINADMLQMLPEPGKYALICSNPPYIPAAEAEEIAKHVRDHEPALALFVPDADPLLFYKAIATYAAGTLPVGGTLYLETHFRWAEQVSELCRTMGFAASVRKDLFGNNRMVKAVKEMPWNVETFHRHFNPNS